MTTRPDTTGKLPLTDLIELKRRGEKIVMVTAYDYPSGGSPMSRASTWCSSATRRRDRARPRLDRPRDARQDDLAGAAAARGAARPLVVADLPFGSYQVSDEEAVRASVRFVKEAGVDAVKAEGAGPTLPPCGRSWARAFPSWATSA